MRRSEALEVRFWRKVDKREPGECWLWKGSKTARGYGLISVKIDGTARNCRAHRISWEIANGTAFPEGKYACHTCDVPSCVNPAHIWPGTQSENISDMWSKGRRKRRLRRLGPPKPKHFRAPLKAPKPPRHHPDFCHRGHIYAEVGKVSNGRKFRPICAACSRMRDRERYALKKSKA